ncbi:MAG: leucine-rich repeat domain-containing protein [Prevotella sp.]|nr:leucine-rich repeat domain-containing protein [Candidatus Equicola faecalis]
MKHNKLQIRWCSGLTSIVVAEGNTKYDSRDNCNAIIETSTNTLIVGCKTTIIPNSVTSIGDRAFAYCSGLTSITIPNSVTSIGESAFSGCKVLSDVKIGKSVEIIGDCAFYKCLCIDSIDIPYGTTAIGDYAFSGCQSLKKVKIPSSVQEIGGYTFYKCPNLEDVYVGWSKPISIGSSVFDKTNGYVLSTLWVPIGRMNFYKVTDTWGKFVEIKEWDSSTGIEEIKINATDEASSASSGLSTGKGKNLYNLQGVKVNGVKKGSVYVRDGRKFIAK